MSSCQLRHTANRCLQTGAEATVPLDLVCDCGSGALHRRANRDARLDGQTKLIRLTSHRVDVRNGANRHVTEGPFECITRRVDEHRFKVRDQDGFADVRFCAIGPVLIEVENGNAELLKLNVSPAIGVVNKPKHQRNHVAP